MDLRQPFHAHVVAAAIGERSESGCAWIMALWADRCLVDAPLVSLGSPIGSRSGRNRFFSAQLAHCWRDPCIIGREVHLNNFQLQEKGSSCGQRTT